MADTSANNGIIPEISYDDGVSTIRINTLDKKGHILTDQPGGVQYTPPLPSQTGYANAAFINDSDVSSVLGNHVAKGDIIEPVLVREKPDGDEIIPIRGMYDYSQHHPPIVPQEADTYRPDPAGMNSVRVENLRSNASDLGLPPNDTTSVLSTTNSILKKSGGKKRPFQQKKISWNENVKIREPENKNKVTVAELQKEDHEYNPIDDPKEEVFHRAVPPENDVAKDIPVALPASATTLPSSPPNGGIELSEDPPPSPRHVHPFGAEDFGERDSKDDANNKWCMRIAICILIFLLTFAVIGLVVLGLVYAWR